MNEADDLSQSTAPVTVGMLTQAMDVLVGEFKKDRAKIADLEQRRLMSFEGGFDPARQYRAGEVVQRGGWNYVCMSGCRDEIPGESARWKRLSEAK